MELVPKSQLWMDSNQILSESVDLYAARSEPKRALELKKQTCSASLKFSKNSCFFTERAGWLMLVQNEHHTSLHFQTKFGLNPSITDFLGPVPKSSGSFISERVFFQTGLDTESPTPDNAETRPLLIIGQFQTKKPSFQCEKHAFLTRMLFGAIIPGDSP